MKLIFIYGLPATGKLTVARELASMTGYKLFHNHLVVDTLLSVFEFGSEAFVELREEIWLSVFRRACESGAPGLIFTFNPESTVRPEFIGQVVDVVGDVDFVELVCPLAELKARLNSPSRLEHRKLSSVEMFERLYADGSFDDSHMPKPRVRVDTNLCTPMEVARQIVAALALPRVSEIGRMRAEKG